MIVPHPLGKRSPNNFHSHLLLICKKEKMKILKIWLLALPIMFFVACNDDDPEIENEEEVITTMTLTLTKADGSSKVFSFQDLDGEGGNEPVITTEPLEANTEYSVQIELLNETETPSENITEEIEEEDDEHQFFYQVDIVNMNVFYEDMDDDGNPIGLSTTFRTISAGTGTLTVILRHEPDKFAEGVADGLIANAGGETDIEVEFDLVIE
jgi:hypothetical protein